MNGEQDHLITTIARYGLPLIVLVFYLTAFQEFEYTPDSTYQVLLSNNSGSHRPGDESSTSLSVSPLWMVLLNLGAALSLDQVMAAKVLSLVFSCMAIIIVYLFSAEVIGDRLIAFCASLVVAMQAWLLQAGPSGNALPLIIALSFATLFLLLRNEYIPATIPAALCTMLMWQAAALIVVLLLDQAVNSRVKRRALVPAIQTLMMYIALLSPWLFYALLNGTQPNPLFSPLNDFGSSSIGQNVTAVLMVVLVVTTAVLLRRQGDEGQRMLFSHIAPAAWIVWLVLASAFGNVELVLVAWPAAIVYAFLGVRLITEYMRRYRAGYTAAFVLTVLLLVQTQLEFLTEIRPHMNRSIERSENLISIAFWLKNNSDGNAMIGADSPALLRYYSGRRVQTLADVDAADYLVSSAADEERFELVFDPFPATHSAESGNTVHHSVWKRK